MPKKLASPKTTQPEPSEIALPEPAVTSIRGSCKSKPKVKTATKWNGAAIATGRKGAASATGWKGTAIATGWMGAASATGKHSVAVAVGTNCKAYAGKTGAICIACRAPDGSILAIRASKVGKNGVKPDTWYRLDASGKFVEMEC